MKCVDMVLEFPKNLFCETKECFWDMSNDFDGQQVENIVVFKSVQFKTQMFSKKNLWMPTSQGPIAWPSASHVCEPGVGVEVEKDRHVIVSVHPYIIDSRVGR